MNEEQLVAMARNGDRNAFATLYAMYKDRLFRYAYCRLGNTADAEDAVADCVASAYQQITGLRDNRAFGGWMFRILYRCCIPYISDQSTRAQQSDIDTVDSGYREYGYGCAELMSVLDSIDPTDREIILLSAVAGYKSREIAELLHIKPGSVRSRMSRALAVVRSELE